VQASSQTSRIQPLTAIVSSSQLVITLAPTSLSFRNETLASGAITTISNSSNLTLTVPTSGTLGTTSSSLARLVVLAVKNGSNMELAITNLAGGINLDETSRITTSSAAATSTNSVYCANNLADTVYRVVGFIDATYISPSGWSSITEVQGAGGQALASLSQQCRAWVNYNGTTGAIGSTSTIRGSYNVSSVTHTATGRWTVNFTTALPDANGTLLCTSEDRAMANVYHGGISGSDSTAPLTTTAAYIVYWAGACNTAYSGAQTDVTYAYVAVFR
jgi:hypothetical protein